MRGITLLGTVFALIWLAPSRLLSAGQGGLSSKQERPGHSFAEKLETRVRQFDAAGEPMAEVAVHLAYRYKLPMAIEHVDRDAIRRPVHIKGEGQSVGELLGAVVSSVPGYRIDFSRGLVDIFSPAARANASNRLNTLIPRYDVNGLDTHFADAQLLCDLGRQIHPRSGCGGSVAGGQWGHTKITLHLTGQRVYQILNAIVAQNGSALWMPTPQHSRPSLIMMNLWYIYPLDGSFEDLAVENLRALVPKAKPRAP